MRGGDGVIGYQTRLSLRASPGDAQGNQPKVEISLCWKPAEFGARVAHRPAPVEPTRSRLTSSGLLRPS